MFFTHQLILSSVEIFSFQKFDMILNKTLISSLISIIFSYLILLIFLEKMRDKLFQILVVVISGLLIIKLFDLQIINNNSSQILEEPQFKKYMIFQKEAIYMTEIKN